MPGPPMSLAPGARLGRYEVIAPIGAGGMGEVYRARDTKLNRDVALKILPTEFASDAERLARFKREAQILASLNHPNIAQIYGFEDGEGIHALAMELVDGSTLADRIARGALSVDDALPIAKQIADALEAAHDQGIIHRDLKPANVKVRDDGTVKVLDFGLAKAVEPSSAAADIASSPTITSPAMTQAGVILGTAAYMSPEQARGKPVDKRTDIWAFGCVLYGMLTSRSAFAGEDVAETLGTVIHKEPDWSRLPPNTPESILRLLRRCLVKDRKHRLQHIGDARLELDEPVDYLLTGARGGTSARATRLRRWSLVLLAVATAASVSWLAARGLGSPTTPLVKRFVIDFGTTPLSEDVALSPDGRAMAYVSGSYEASQLYVRVLDQMEPRRLPDTTGARNPFFSPDGQWIAFATVTGLSKSPVEGGAAVRLTSVRSSGSQGTWGPNGTIAFSDGGQLWTVSENGGKPTSLSELDATQGEVAHTSPHFLPGGNAVLFLVQTSSSENASRVAVQKVGTKSHQVILQGAERAIYVATGHLVFIRSAALYAVPFDPVRLIVTGSQPTPLSTGLRLRPHFALGSDGTLVLIESAQEARRTLVWVDRRGVASEVNVPPRAYRDPALSPDGKRLVLSVTGGPQAGLWIGETERTELVPWVVAPGAGFAAWTPTGTQVTYSRPRSLDDDSEIVLQDVDGLLPPQTLYTSERGTWPGSWTSDGRGLVIMEVTADGGGDISLLVPGTGSPRPVVQTRATEWGAKLSPDGRWIAYVSNQSGQWEVFLEPFPGPGTRRPVSVGGGTEVVWARSGQELYYRSGSVMMVVPVRSSGASVSIGSARRLWEGLYELGSPGGHNYDVTPDGSRFLMIRPADEGASGRVHVILNWHEELKRLVPVN